MASGKAEIFGVEMVPNKAYQFLSDANVAVFTFHGCRLKLKGVTKAYIGTNTPMVSGPGLCVDVCSGFCRK